MQRKIRSCTVALFLAIIMLIGLVPTAAQAESEAAIPTFSTDLSTETVEYSEGDTAGALTVAATVTDEGVLSYQWYGNGENSTEGGTEVGENSPSYTPSTDTAGTTYYYVVVTNTLGEGETATTATATSQVACVTVAENTAPSLTSGVEAELEAQTVINYEYSVTLPEIFEDADGDELTYTVSVNGGDPVEAGDNYYQSYTYKPTETGTTTLVFTANDGVADSPTYTVTLTAVELDSHTLKVLVNEGPEARFYTAHKIYDASGSSVVSDSGYSYYNVSYQIDNWLLNNQFTIRNRSWDDDNYNFTGWHVNGEFIPVSEADAAGETITRATLETVGGYNAFVQYDRYYYLYLTNAAECETTATPTEITSDITVEPVFEKKTPDTETYSVSAASADETMGTASAAHLRDNIWTIEASPLAGYTFAEWNDGVTSASRTVTASADTAYVAYFIKVETLSLTWDENADATIYLNFYQHLEYNVILNDDLTKSVTCEFRPDRLTCIYVRLKSYDSDNYAFKGYYINGQFVSKTEMDAGMMQVQLAEDIGVAVYCFSNDYSIQICNLENFLGYIGEIDSAGDFNLILGSLGDRGRIRQQRSNGEYRDRGFQ